ncbi:MAG: RelA/SpoT family protein [Candidatus Vogelbacteria bacterium]|nr:RelA/SpoT family protein [Candidatus Vogelbacteria bacterium]
MLLLDPQEITSKMKNPAEAGRRLVAHAFSFAQKAHEGQRRKSGEPYFLHPYNVALILADFGADAETIAAGLLHDTVEDTGITPEIIKKDFGTTVAFMVDGVTKLGELKYKGVARHAESLRKMFVAMAEDIRVIVIRLADRLHNVRTLQYVEPEKQKRIALETLEIYAPLANRLGMWKMKGLLEDASFPYAYPNEYKQVVTLRKTKGKETIKRLEKIYRVLQGALAERGFKDFSIDYRIKYLYSLWAKLKRNNMDIESIYDISALRLIVDNVEQCYQALGIIHSLWRTVPGKLKDYIAGPKPNGYQSIHTAVFTGDGSIVEIQIRTKAMQREAELGAASHILYDEAGKPKGKDAEKKIPKSIKWISDLIEWQKNVKESDEFLHTLKTDFIRDRIFVFTPKGDVVELPKGATMIDFAYTIHSDIGNHASGAWMNGKYVPLDTELTNKCTVKIETKKIAKPSIKWLDFAKTTIAKRHIRNYLGLENKPPVKSLFNRLWGK